MNSKIDYYKILGIPRNASPLDIKNAFRREIKKWHPDRNHSLEAEARTKQIIEAWITFKDQEKKKLYDRSFEAPSDYSDEFRRWQEQAQNMAKETSQKPLEEILKEFGFKIINLGLWLWSVLGFIVFIAIIFISILTPIFLFYALYQSLLKFYDYLGPFYFWSLISIIVLFCYLFDSNGLIGVRLRKYSFFRKFYLKLTKGIGTIFEIIFETGPRKMLDWAIKLMNIVFRFDIKD